MPKTELVKGTMPQALLDAVEDIGRHGEEKYGAESFQIQRAKGDRTRDSLRKMPGSILAHATNHIAEYENGVLHDHFHTKIHQLAAAIFNLTMECYFAGLDAESGPDQPPATAPNPEDPLGDYHL